MLASAARRGARAIAGLVRFQLLPYRVELTFDDDALEPVLGALANSARQPVEPRATMRYHVSDRGPYAVSEERDHLATVARPDDVALTIVQRCHARLVDYLTLGHWGALRGGIARVSARRALIVGGPGPDLEPLLRQLDADGHSVEGDGLVFFRGGEAVCLPTNASTEVELAPVEIVFVLVGAARGAARCQPMSTVELVQKVVANSLPWLGSAPGLVRAVSTLVGSVDAYELRGDLPDAARLLATTVS